MSPHLSLRPIKAKDLPDLGRVLLEPEILGFDWSGFGDVGALRRRHAEDGFLGDRSGALAVDVDGTIRGSQFRDGAWRDVVLYGLLRSDLDGSESTTQVEPSSQPHEVTRN